MKKILLVLLVLVVAFAGCRKDNPDQDDGTAEVSFVLSQSQQLKNDPLPDDDYNCWTEEGDYAFVRIEGVDYFLDVFYLDGIPYTQTIKLPVGGTYNVQEFMLMNDMQTPDDTSDDQVVMASPHANAEWSQYVETALDITFDITGFDKLELQIEVLCYEEQFYDQFGFIYFDFYQIVVRQACFFGDICIKSLTDYAGSWYDLYQPNGLQYDMPAIFKIEVLRNGNLMETYTNELHADGSNWYGAGEPLCVWYADRLEDLDEFEFKLYIYVDDGAGFSYKYFHSWFFNDVIPAGWDVEEDGVIDFALGSCVVDPDLALAPYMDLPDECTLQIDSYHPGNIGDTYFDLELGGIPDGYDISNGIWPGWCIQSGVTITLGSYDMDVYSSLYPIPDIPVYPWDEVNWLVNNLDWYEGDAGYSYQAIQAAFWKIANGQIGFTIGATYLPGQSAESEALAQQMYTDATNYGDGFIPLPGYWAAVVFVDQEPPLEGTQVVFVMVDP